MARIRLIVEIFQTVQTGHDSYRDGTSHDTEVVEVSDELLDLLLRKGVPSARIVGAEPVAVDEANTGPAATDTTEGLRDACRLYREASRQSHSGHWDREGTRGANCPECQKADELRARADNILARARESLDDDVPRQNNRT